MRVRFLAPAEVEAEEAARYFDERRAGLGDRFEQELLDAVRFLSANPLAGHPVTPQVRSLRLRTFRYNVLYVRDDLDLVIVAVAHHRRRPGYWRDRL